MYLNFVLLFYSCHFLFALCLFVLIKSWFGIQVLRNFICFNYCYFISAFVYYILSFGILILILILILRSKINKREINGSSGQKKRVFLHGAHVGVIVFFVFTFLVNFHTHLVNVLQDTDRRRKKKMLDI